MQSSVASSELTFDPDDRDTVRDPHGIFRRLRAEAPLYHNEERGFYALSRFHDIERALADTRTFSSRWGVSLELLEGNMEMPPGTVILEDPPTHTVHRGIISRMFTARRVSGLEPTIRQLCADLLDPLVGAGGFDIVTDLGAIVPMRVVSSLIGIPESDQQAVRDHFNTARQHEDVQKTVLTGEIFADYIDWRIENPSDDIMTILLNAEFEDVDGVTRRLTREELLAFINIIAAAGNETTMRLIGWTGKLLADHPGERRKLVEDPSLVPNAIEEILRYEPSALQACRRLTAAAELHGVTVPEGAFLCLLIPSANRDEDYHTDPDTFDVQRGREPHLTFGFGAHYCLGQALARLEARVALEELLKRFPEWEVDADGAVFGHLPDMRGFDRLPVVTA